MYIVQKDIEDRFGSDMVANWSRFNDGKSEVSDPARISVAISLVESLVNSVLRNGPYLVPIQAKDGSATIPLEIVEATAEMTGYWLWKKRGLNDSKETRKMMEDRNQAATRILYAIRVGQMAIDAAFNTSRCNVPQVVNPCRRH